MKEIRVFELESEWASVEPTRLPSAAGFGESRDVLDHHDVPAPQTGPPGLRTCAKG